MHLLKRAVFGLLFLVLPMAVLAAKVNLNTADSASLQTLEGIGEAKAAAIVTYREKNGPFSSVDEVVEVSGIGEATLESNREQLSVE